MYISKHLTDFKNIILKLIPHINSELLMSWMWTLMAYRLCLSQNYCRKIVKNSENLTKLTEMPSLFLLSFPLFTPSLCSLSAMPFCSLFSFPISSGSLMRTLLFREAEWIEEKPSFPSYKTTLSFAVKLVCIKLGISIQLFGEFYKLSNIYYLFEFYCFTEENRGVLKNFAIIEFP